MQTVSILVVEDDPDINDLLCTILRRQGFQVTGAFREVRAECVLPSTITT